MVDSCGTLIHQYVQPINLAYHTMAQISLYHFLNKAKLFKNWILSFILYVIIVFIPVVSYAVVYDTKYRSHIELLINFVYFSLIL